MRILVADDEQHIRDSLARSLRSWGYEVELAENGAEAWNRLKQADAPRFVIIDWDMPFMKGLEVVRLLRTAEHGHEFSVLMLTGRVEKGDLVEALESGVDDYLTKPFNARELQLRLARARSSSDRHVEADNTAAELAGSVLGGRYRLEKSIGQGGMADVWLGRHIALDIPVAVKFMKETIASRADYPSFEREARAVAKLRDSHVLHVYDHGITRSGIPYLVMEFLEGESFAEYILRAGRLPPRVVVEFVEQIARGLAEAHRCNVIHGDVKPENIVLIAHPDWPDSLAKLIDFGLARNTTELPVGGLISGTPNYMPPEHLTGTEAANVALDVWALAVTAFLALTGNYPFDGPTLPSLVHKICNVPAPAASSFLPGLRGAPDDWFHRAFSKDPRQRFQTVDELATTFKVALADAAREWTKATAPTVLNVAAASPTQFVEPDVLA